MLFSVCSGNFILHTTTQFHGLHSSYDIHRYLNYWEDALNPTEGDNLVDSLEYLVDLLPWIRQSGIESQIAQKF